MAKDIVAEFIRLAAQMCPSFTEDVAMQIEAQLRQTYGGTEPGYIAKTPESVEKRKRLARDEAMRSGRVVDAADKYGISRRTMYRLLKK